MRFASLGSGSRGNSLIVESADTCVLLDCGFSTRLTLAKLARLARSPADITAILVTHEHGDHIAGVFKLAARFALPVYLSHGTYAAATKNNPPLFTPFLIESQRPFAIGDLEINPFPVPHDAREPLQFTLSSGKHRLGVLTDSGVSTPHIVASLQSCDALVLECNHDSELLAASPYPASLKQRISSRLGHLSNEQAASLLAQLETQKLQHIVAAHISEQNNRPELAASALANVLNCSNDWIGIASQETGFAWRELL